MEMRTGTACPACSYSRPRWRGRRGTYICEHCGQEWGTEGDTLLPIAERKGDKMKHPECPVCGVSRPALTEEMAQPPGSDARCQAECIITSCHCCLSWWQESERQAIEGHLNHWQEIERHYQERGEDPPAGVVGLRRKWEKRKQDMAGQERIEQEQAYRRAMFHIPETEVKG